MGKTLKYPGKLGEKRKYNELAKEPCPDPDEYQNPNSGERLYSIYLKMIAKAHQEEMDLNKVMFQELMKYYKVDTYSENRWMALAVALAFDHVPCFQMEKGRRSAPTQWTISRMTKLVDDVDSVRKSRTNMSINQACENLKRKTKYKNIRDLPRRYRDSIKKLRELGYLSS